MIWHLQGSFDQAMAAKFKDGQTYDLGIWFSFANEFYFGE